MRACTAALFVCLLSTGCTLSGGEGRSPRSDGRSGAGLNQDGGSAALDAGPAACFGRSPQDCSATPGCMWQWSPCMMMACAPYDGGCPACDPAGSCVPVSPPPQSHCQGLNERLCNETPGCLGVYDGPCSTCPDPANCFCSSAFDHCTDDAFCGSGSGNTCSGSTGGGTAVDGGPAPTGP